MKRRILLVAHHLNPDWGSEPLIGWRWATHLQDEVELHVITHIRNKKYIESNGTLNAEIHYVDTERIASAINKINGFFWKKTAIVAKSILESFSLRAFDREATRIARELVSQNKVDVIHRVSPISPRIGTNLSSLDAPVVVGPVNGGMEMAKGFDEVARKESNGALALRNLAKLSAPFERSIDKASEVVVATETTRRVLSKEIRYEAPLISENAIIPEDFTPSYERQGEGFELLYLGRLLPCKGVEYLIQAMSLLEDVPHLNLTIVGDGPERANLEAMVAERGHQSRVKFLGHVPVSDVPMHMRQCDLFLLPGLRESGGAVILEAMACGKPFVVFNHGGPAETVNAKVGVKIDAAGPEELVAKLAETITAFMDNEKIRQDMGRAARAHVESNYSWRKKIQTMLEIYDQVINVNTRRIAS